MKSKDVRKKFFEFFKNLGHEHVSSSSLIPAQDPTLLFTNAGMNQFKDVFLGDEERSYKKAVTIQKCMRAGGKHNDLDNVGFTPRHLTFFEMMGNFSFGDYFKKDAIKYAWDFLTNQMAINPNDLWVSVYKDDEDSYKIWKDDIGVPESRIIKLGEADNFWSMGDVGPCGPCTEIYLDHGKSFGCGKVDCKPGCDCDRFLEVWNLVFMEFNRDESGKLTPLKQKGVDTGVGIERLVSVLQNKDSVFETDIFSEIINQIEKLTGLKYKDLSKDKKAAFNVLADHIRSAVLLIADGCAPSNDGRGYVLRKIIRRAALFERKISDKSIFPKLVDSVVLELGDVYPEIKINKDLIQSVIESEVDKFHTNLIRGSVILQGYMDQSEKNIISGEEAFKLYDTYGFPLELVEILAKERGFSVDKVGFEKNMEKQKILSGKKMIKKEQELKLPEHIATNFVGYQTIKNESSLLAIIDYENNLIESVDKDQHVWLVTKESPFFVACGGQVDDVGYVEINGLKSDILVLKKIDNAIAVKIKTKGKINIGDVVVSVVDEQHRLDTMNNHTATHLLQAALIDMLGKQVKQSGSVVTPDYLRFDFTYHKNLTSEQINHIEKVVNQKIRENIPVSVEYTTYKEAINKGVIAIFGEKYNPEDVRVIDIPGFSAELCGGTHVKRTGDIGCFKIIQEGALSAGNRRIFALTGPKAIELFQDTYSDIKKLSQDFKVKVENVVEAIEKQKNVLKAQNLKINELKKELVGSKIPIWLNDIKKICDMNYLFIELDNFDNSDLKDLVNKIHQKKECFIFVVNKLENRYGFLMAIPKSYLENINLKELSKNLKDVGLRGGGSNLMIQGGAEKIDKDQVEELIFTFLY